MNKSSEKTGPNNTAEKLFDQLDTTTKINACLITLSLRNVEEAYDSAVRLQISQSEVDPNSFTDAIQAKIDATNAFNTTRKEAKNIAEFDSAVLQTEKAIMLDSRNSVIHLYSEVISLLNPKNN